MEYSDSIKAEIKISIGGRMGERQILELYLQKENEFRIVEKIEMDGEN